jgi:hypothetical protein
MKTSRSPRMVFITAHFIGQKVFREYSGRFSRRDFTLAQLFACLVLREFYGLSYRRTEQLLRDSPQWLAEVGLEAPPDHNTLWRSLGLLTRSRPVHRLLDLLARCFKRMRWLRLKDYPLALDSTYFEQRHRSLHYDRRCRQMGDSRKDKVSAISKSSQKTGSWSNSVNRSRRRRLRVMPKLSVAVASGCHLILAMKVRTGGGADAPDFADLLNDAGKRAKVKVVVADAGYDSEENHRLARQQMGVRSIIPAGNGRPTDKLPSGRWRRHMARRFKQKADQPTYSQRAQSETVHSMIKRNCGSALRSRTPQRKKQEMRLRVITHNIMLLCGEQSEE